MITIKSSPFARAFAAAALLGTFAVAQPSYAASSSSMEQTDQSDKSSSMSSKKAPSPAEMKQHVEERIKTLHAKLNITSDQESTWKDFSQAMRDNETAMGSAIEARHENAENMSAVDDLQTYQKIAQAHADGLQKLVTAFQPVYDSMSDDQKKNADQVFGQFEGHRGVTKASAKGSEMGSGMKSKKATSGSDDSSMDKENSGSTGSSGNAE